MNEILGKLLDWAMETLGGLVGAQEVTKSAEVSIGGAKAGAEYGVTSPILRFTAGGAKWK
jgi:hypothetical protein